MIFAIVRRTAADLLLAPSTWLAFALLLGGAGFFFLAQLEAWIEIQDRLALRDNAPGLGGWLGTRFLAPMAGALAIVAPLLALRAFAGDRRQVSRPLWYSAPVSMRGLVAGRYLGILLVLAMPVGLVLLMPLALLPWIDLDAGSVLAAGLGLLLAAAAFASVGLFFSTLAASLPVAALASLALIGLSWLLGERSATNALDALLRELSPGAHLAGFFQGYLQSGDVLWFLLVSLLFLGLAVLRLDAVRYRGY